MTQEKQNIQLQPFEGWLTFTLPFLTLVKETGIEKLSDEPGFLLSQLVKIEAYFAHLQYLLAEANAYLDVAEAERLVPKEPGITDIDREKQLAAAVVEERLVRDKIEGQCEFVKQRINLGQSILKYYQMLGLTSPTDIVKPKKLIGDDFKEKEKEEEIPF